MSDSIFVFSSVGSSLDVSYKQSVFESWELKDFDSGCVIYNHDDQFPYNTYFKNLLNKTGFKFPNFFYFDQINNIIDNYDYICILDDDLLFKEPNSINETINLMNKFDISLCSLSNNFEGKPSYHKIMRSENTEKPKIAITNFCEMGCMIFKKNLLVLCKTAYYHEYAQLSDWGFDLLVCSIAEQHNLNIGIIKHLSFLNPSQPKRNYGHNNWILYKNKIKHIDQKIYKIIDL